MVKFIQAIEVIFIVLFLALPSVAQVPNTFSIDGTKPMKSKIRVESGEATFVAARQELIKDADMALKRGPYSVTCKDVIPPGGTKNDYYSLSRYWWPDPSKPEGLPYIPKDGKVNPEREKIPDYEMMNNMGNDVFLLALAFFFTEDEKYAKHAKLLVDVFFFQKATRMNPHFEYSQIIRGRPDSGGATISATSLVPFVEGVQLLQGSKHWNKRDKRRLQEWFSDFLNWMLNSSKGRREASLTNNIGTYYTMQTAVYALFIGDSQLAKQIILEQAYDRIKDQINVNGEMPQELKRATPWAYIKYNTVAFNKLVEVAKKVDVDLLAYESADGVSLKKLYEWLSLFLSGKRTWNYSEEKVNPSDVYRVYKNHGVFDHMLQDKNLNASKNYREILF